MAATKKSYKDLLTECLNLRGKSGTGAFKRAVALRTVYNDPEYRKFCAAELQDPAEFLDQYVEDLCLTFLEIKTVLDHHENQADWEDGKLATLYEQTETAIRNQGAGNGEEQGSTRPSYKTLYSEASDKIKDLQFEQKQTLEKSQSLEERVAELTAENMRLRGRIEELERLLSRERLAV